MREVFYFRSASCFVCGWTNIYYAWGHNTWPNIFQYNYWVLYIIYWDIYVRDKHMYGLIGPTWKQLSLSELQWIWRIKFIYIELYRLRLVFQDRCLEMPLKVLEIPPKPKLWIKKENNTNYFTEKRKNIQVWVYINVLFQVVFNFHMLYKYLVLLGS